MKAVNGLFHWFLLFLYLSIVIECAILKYCEIYICISRHWIMFLFILICSIYFILLDFLSFIFSIRLCGTIPSSTSDNFECGFYSILTSSSRYRFSYWIIIINYCIFEQELILASLWIFAITINIKSNYLLILSLSIPSIEVIHQMPRSFFERGAFKKAERSVKHSDLK